MLNSSWHMNLSLGVYTGWALRYKVVVPKAPICFFFKNWKFSLKTPFPFLDVVFNFWKRW